MLKKKYKDLSDKDRELLAHIYSKDIGKLYSHNNNYHILCKLAGMQLLAEHGFGTFSGHKHLKGIVEHLLNDPGDLDYTPRGLVSGIKENINVIFLDIDGVLNSQEYFNSFKEEDRIIEDDSDQVDKDKISIINTICKKTDAYIIISSSWRLIHSIESIVDLFNYKGFTGNILGKTPYSLGIDPCRGDDIQGWLDKYPGKINNFVIIDDDSDMGHLAHKLVKTTFAEGFKEHHVEGILKHLEENK